MSLETLLILVVSISAVAVVVQNIATYRTFRLMRQTVERISKQSEDLKKETEQLMLRVQKVMGGLKSFSRLSERVDNDVQLICEMATKRVGDLDQFVEELMQIGREQASKIDYVVTDTVQKFEQTTEAIQGDVLRPAVEISSFLKGIKMGLDYLLGKKSKQPLDSSSE